MTAQWNGIFCSSAHFVEFSAYVLFFGTIVTRDI